jgi:hypothetical protein
MHEITSVAEMRRLYGAVIDEAIKVQVPGMEIGTQHKYSRNILLDFKREESPLRPEAAEAMRQNAASRQSGNPCATFFGFPLAGLLSEPIKIVQSPRVTVVLYEVNNLHRQIFTDGRVLPKEFELPAYLGYSAGHWERDVLVVETAGFNDKTPLDAMGHPHSEALRITELFPPPRLRTPGRGNDLRRPQDVYEALYHQGPPRSAGRRRHLRNVLQRKREGRRPHAKAVG